MPRTDNIGLFWEDMPAPTRGKDRVFRLAPIPETGWRKLEAHELPNLSAAKRLAVDTETKNVNLKKTGPWWGRNEGHLVGVSLATADGFGWYLPMRHEVNPDDNMDPEVVIRFLKDVLENSKPKVGQNLFYDIGGLWAEGVKIRGPWIDVGYAEALLEEDKELNLDRMLNDYLGEEKEMSLLDRWLGDTYGNNKKDKRENIYRAPPSLVGPYAIQDVRPLFRLFEKQWPRLQSEGLVDLFRKECKLIELFVKMRMNGVAVDINRAEQVRDTLREKGELIRTQIDEQAGFKVNVGSSDDLSRLFKKFQIPYPSTPKGKPSFRKDFLDGLDHPIGDLIRGARKMDKLAGTFCEGYILNGNVNGRVYGSFNSMRGERGGTRSGRLSSSNPNLQNIPSREEELLSLGDLKVADLIRDIFIPGEGYRWWRKYDYSQIEYRFLAHFAVGPGSDNVRAQYVANPNLDYHDATYNMVCPFMGWDPNDAKMRKVRRKQIKGINFGLLYGMGVPKLARTLGLSLAEAKVLFKAYHKAAPFVSATMEHYSNQARQYGYIETILGRRSRFDLWEPAGYGKKDGAAKALPFELAMQRWGVEGPITRAYTHKAVNRVLQGSAADQMKMGMLQCYEDGVFDVTGLPTLTVHDELDFPDDGSAAADEGFREVQRIMESVLSLRVPILADFEIGKSWGKVSNPYPVAA